MKIAVTNPMQTLDLHISDVLWYSATGKFVCALELLINAVLTKNEAGLIGVIDDI
ncbi:hypothetical protein KDI_38950 [Dictyobacter arantiisoli]|uniref:Uncharacterized protein n=1 Tax=Dictyobacter arantiisoli TaxID=2014874 RepID=A0A5A5TFI3_9CHLR|nr:hypothetical protein KDI_38950 [Dictyobacter arantiisoli]